MKEKRVRLFKGGKLSRVSVLVRGVRSLRHVVPDNDRSECRSSKFTYLGKSAGSPTQDRFPMLFLLYERLNLKTILTVMMAVRHRHTLPPPLLLLLLPLLKAVGPVLQRGYMGNKVGGLLEHPRRKVTGGAQNSLPIKSVPARSLPGWCRSLFWRSQCKLLIISWLSCVTIRFSGKKKNLRRRNLFPQRQMAAFAHFGIWQRYSSRPPGVRLYISFGICRFLFCFFFWNSGHEFNLYIMRISFYLFQPLRAIHEYQQQS